MGNCTSNINLSANPHVEPVPSSTSYGEAPVARHLAAQTPAELHSSSRAAFSILGMCRRVALFADWETKKALRLTDHTSRQAGTEAMRKLTIPLADIDRLGNALTALPSTLDLTITGINQGNQHQLAAIARLPDHIKSKIHRLDIAGTYMTGAALAPLAGLSELRSLNLSGSRHLHADGMTHLQGLNKLETLDLSGCHQLTQGDGVPLRFPKNVRSLNLSGCWRLTGDDFAALRPLTQLQSLDLSRCNNLTDGALRNLQFSTDLQTLNLSVCGQVTGTGFEHLLPLTELRSLNLESSRSITGVGFEHLRTLPNLQSLNLEFCRQLDDDGLMNLRGIEQLRNLHTAGCPRLTQWSLQHFRDVIEFDRF